LDCGKQIVDPRENDNDVGLQVNYSLREDRDAIVATVARDARVIDSHLGAIVDSCLNGLLDYCIQRSRVVENRG
jgi:hypothetical protein